MSAHSLEWDSFGQHHPGEVGARVLGDHLEGHLRRISGVGRAKIDRISHSNIIRNWRRDKL